MSKLKTNTIRHVDGSNDNITLDSSQNVTVEGNLTVDGTSTLTGNVTASGQLKADALRHTGASSDAVTLASDGTCTAKITNNLSNRNLIINGAMQVAQRGSDDTSDVQGYTTVDRWTIAWGGANNVIDRHQQQLSSSDTGPWAKGFRHSLKLVNGDQSSADAGDFVQIVQSLEAQDIANSGWDYTSASSYITYSFWVKSSKAQNFYGSIESVDGTSKRYIFETGTLTANTWTKVTKTIPGVSGLQFDLNADRGLTIYLFPFVGTSMTASNTLNTWANSTGTNYANNTSSDWWLDNDATFEITGVQLEVGDVATDFEHRSYGDELLRCMRYCQRYDTGGDTWVYFAQGNTDNDNETFPLLKEFMIPMRVKPSSMTTTGTASDYYVRRDSSKACSAVPTYNSPGPYSVQVIFKSASHGWSTGDNVKGYLKDSGAYLLFSAEL